MSESIKRRTLLAACGACGATLSGLTLWLTKNSSHASQREARWIWSRGVWYCNDFGDVRQWLASATINLEVIESIRRKGPEYAGLEMNEDEFFGAPPYSLLIRKVLTIPAEPLLIPPSAKSLMHTMVVLEQHKLPFRKHEVGGHDFDQLFSGGNIIKREVF